MRRVILQRLPITWAMNDLKQALIAVEEFGQ
jgi:hypothetical protein